MPVREERWSEAARQLRLGLSVTDLEPGQKFARRSVYEVLTLAGIDDIFTREDRNIGILMEPKNLLVFDADSEEAEDWLERNGLMDSNTIAKTPKGKHVYYRHECQGLKTRLSFDRIPLDIKATGHVVAPGSVVEGKVYDWLAGPRHVKLLPIVPDRIITMIREDMERAVKPKAAPRIVAATRADVMKITNPRAYCLRIPSIQGQAGSKGLVRVVCVLRDCGWTPDQILAFVFGEWNERCAVPPWSEGEVVHCINRHCSQR